MQEHAFVGRGVEKCHVKASDALEMQKQFACCRPFDSSGPQIVWAAQSPLVLRCPSAQMHLPHLPLAQPPDIWGKATVWFSAQ